MFRVSVVFFIREGHILFVSNFVFILTPVGPVDRQYRLFKVKTFVLDELFQHKR